MNSVKLLPKNTPDNVRISVSQGAYASVEAYYEGHVTIGYRSIIHPNAVLIAEAGPIIIGQSNIIEEGAQIINRYTANEDKCTPKTLVIGNCNTFEVNSICRAPNVGHGNIFQVKSYVGPTVEVSDGCVIGVKCSLVLPQILSKDTVVYGENNTMRKRCDIKTVNSNTLQVEMLIKIFRNHHRMVKPTKRLSRSKC